MKKTLLILTIQVFGLLLSNANAATVGTTGATYATLKLAFAAINNGTLTGDVVLQIVDNTTETATASLNASGTGSANYTSVTIYPTVDNLSITSTALFTNTSTLIDLIGADNVTIDGRVNQSGARSLTIASIMTGAPTISLNSDATYNKIKYCNIKGNASSQKGVLVFSTGVTLGNSNNEIDNNLFTNNGTRPIFTIFATGTPTAPNDGNKIINNDFKDCISTTLSTIVIFIYGSDPAVSTSAVNTNYEVSGNSFYETTKITTSGTTTAVAMTMIQIGSTGRMSGAGHVIKDNYIGGTDTHCGGGTFTKDGYSNLFTGIQVFNSTPNTVVSIQNNTIQKISFTNVVGATWQGINVSGSANYNIGTVAGNTIGDNTTTGSIDIVNGSTASVCTLISIGATGTVNCQNNKIGSINSSNLTAGTISTINGIYKLTGAGTTNISSNIIGSPTTSNSIYAKTGGGSFIYSIYCQSTASDNVIDNNQIGNLTNGSTLNGNSYGIYASSTGTNTISRNFIHDLNMTSALTAGILIGIGVQSGNSTCTNNIISLGNDIPSTIFGIYEVTAAIATNLYHNTVYIGGHPASLALVSAAIYRKSTVVTGERNYINNILVNNRVNNGATGNNYAIWSNAYTNTSSNFVCNNNDLYVTADAYNFIGLYSTSNAALTIADWRLTSFGTYNPDANSLNIDPSFANAGGTLAEDYKPSSAATLTGTPINTVTIDYAEIGRSATQPKMGAYETSFSTGINNKIETIGTFILRNETGIIIPLTTPSKIELYGINGMLIEKTIATGNYSRSLNNGMYIILINGKPTKFLK
jgi:hypothetical protein